jgi:hypothetical protein
VRHDEVCAHLHYSVCRALGIETTDKGYTHPHTHTHTKPVCEHEDVTSYGIEGYTQKLRASRPDIIINKKRKHAYY